MRNNRVVDQLEQVFKYCATLERLPHSFDETLIDDLIDKVDFTDSRLGDFVKTRLSSTNFEADASVAVSLVLRLYSKYCLSLSDDDMDVVRQLERTEVLLEQRNRPANLLSDLLGLYTACYRFRRQCEWKNVIIWCVSNLPNEGISIFIRRQIADFLSLNKCSDEMKLFLPAIAELFCHTDSNYVRNDAASILTNFTDHLNNDQIRSIINTVQSIGLAGDVVYQLAAKVQPDMELAGDLSPTIWKNETARCHLIMKILEQSSRHEDVNDLFASVVVSPCMKLRWFVDVIDLLSDKTLHKYLPKIHHILLDPRRSPLSDLQSMLSKLSARLTLSEISPILDRCFPRLLESPYLIEAVCKAYGSDCLDHPTMTDIRDKLALEIGKAISNSDYWEVRDTALEVATIVPSFRPTLGPLRQLVVSDPSPYVRAAALRCLIMDAECYEQEVPQLCESVVCSDPDAEPRLVAIRYLHSTLPSNIENVFRILPKAIEASDDEIRRLMVEMCSTLLVTKEYAADTAAELQEWIEDPEIGADVRAVLGKSPVEQPNPVEHILTDMMNALSLHFSDTIDCY
ncbi:hypothetical protein KIN20_001807 [Parelaphostrongylus tenuis]|uniref:HEAT repeat protein n=1 Tax=Parelaphostrongylus tenuis TaxID=148309 RepID=A0AAD5QEW9_PARTN|nr:hypothetical protein KIN20_001807 [Parelaphostrongylus tenuis]